MIRPWIRKEVFDPQGARIRRISMEGLKSFSLRYIVDNTRGSRSHDLRSPWRRSDEMIPDPRVGRSHGKFRDLVKVSNKQCNITRRVTARYSKLHCVLFDISGIYFVPLTCAPFSDGGEIVLITRQQITIVTVSGVQC